MNTDAALPKRVYRHQFNFSTTAELTHEFKFRFPLNRKFNIRCDNHFNRLHTSDVTPQFHFDHTNGFSTNLPLLDHLKLDLNHFRDIDLSTRTSPYHTLLAKFNASFPNSQFIHRTFSCRFLIAPSKPSCDISISYEPFSTGHLL